MQAAMSDSSLHWYKKPSVLVVDTAFSKRSFLFEQSQHDNLVVIARCRSNRVFYQSPPVEELNKKRGCPKKYGEQFDLGTSLI
ncbi:MAG: transposase [Cyanobacteria bacterium P01_A01_bin.68]